MAEPPEPATRRCPDCDVPAGAEHTDLCDAARCLRTGEQRRSCDHPGLSFHDCGRDTWTGRRPGQEDAAGFGWYTRLDRRGWRSYGPDDPMAVPDLGRLRQYVHWDAASRRWLPGPCRHAFVERVGSGPRRQPEPYLDCVVCGCAFRVALLRAIGFDPPSRPAPEA